jgi:hypothetical protein
MVLFYFIFLSLCVSLRRLVIGTFIIFLITSLFVSSLHYFSIWGELGYMFGCDHISYGLILLRFWI